jgi:Peptidase family C54
MWPPVSESEEVVEAFLTAFRQLLWVTYRKGFPVLKDGSLTYDTGWGCMIRTGQMAVAHALQRQLLGEGAFSRETA